MLLRRRQFDGVERGDGLPWLSGRDECPGRIGRQFEPEVARRPEIAAAFISAALLERIDRVLEALGHDGERLAFTVDEHAQWRQIAAGRQLETVAERVQPVR